MGIVPSQSVITEKTTDTNSDDVLLIRSSDGKAYDIGTQSFLRPSDAKLIRKYSEPQAQGNYFIGEKITDIDKYKVVTDGDCDTKYILGWQRNAPLPQAPLFEIKDKRFYDIRCQGYLSTTNGDSLRIVPNPDTSLYAITNNTPLFDSKVALPDYYYFRFINGYYLSISGNQLALSSDPFIWRYTDQKLSNQSETLFIAKNFSCTSNVDDIAVISIVSMFKTWIIYNQDANKYIGLNINPNISTYDALNGAIVSFWIKEYNWVGDASGDWLTPASGLSDRGQYRIVFKEAPCNCEFYLESAKNGKRLRMSRNDAESLTLRDNYELLTFTLDRGNTIGVIEANDFKVIPLSAFLHLEFYLKPIIGSRSAFGPTSDNGYIRSSYIASRPPFYSFIYSYNPSAYRLSFGGIIAAIRSNMSLIPVSLDGVPIPSGYYSIARGNTFFDKTGTFTSDDVKWTYDDNKFIVNKSPYNTTILNLDIKDNYPDVIDLKCSPFDDDCTTSVPNNNKLIGYATDSADKIGDYYDKRYCYDLLGNKYVCADSESAVNFIKHEPEPTNMNMFRKDVISVYSPTEAIIAPSCPMPAENKYNFLTFGEDNVNGKYARIATNQYANSDDRNRGCCNGQNTWTTSIKRYNDSSITITRVRDNLYKISLLDYMNILKQRKDFYPNITNLDGAYIETGYNPNKTIVAQGGLIPPSDNLYIIQVADGSRYAFPVRWQDLKTADGKDCPPITDINSILSRPQCHYVVPQELYGYPAVIPRALSRIIAGNVYKGDFYFLTDDNKFFDSTMNKGYIHEGKITMDPGYCSSAFCPFSTECKRNYPETINNYCSDIDSSGYPRLNTDPDCLLWCSENKDRCYGIGDAFCRKYPDHPACGCANYTNSNEYKSVLDQFVTQGDTKSSSIIPSPYCWAPVCTQSNDLSNKNRPVLTSLLSRAKCDGIDLTFCNMYTKVSDTGGNVTISDNVYNQFCGNREDDTKGDTGGDTKGNSGGDTKGDTGGDSKDSSGEDTKENKGYVDSVIDYFGLGGDSKNDTKDDTKGDTKDGTEEDKKENKGYVDSVIDYFGLGSTTTTGDTKGDTSSGGTTLTTTHIIMIVVAVVTLILAIIMYFIFRKKGRQNK